MKREALDSSGGPSAGAARIDDVYASRHEPSLTDMRRRQMVVVLEEVARRRASGEAVLDADVVASHPDLLPDLSSCLAALPRVEIARAMATGRSDDLPRIPAARPKLPGYDLVDEIHRGGQGVVYRAIQRSTGREVAVKIIHGGPYSGPSELHRFQREVQVLARLRHPNIVAIHDSGDADGHYFFAMDLVRGQPLDLAAARDTWSVRQIVELFVKVCDAVAAAHLQGIVHRDLKPGNILVDEHGEPRVLDFGLAKAAPQMPDVEQRWATLTHTGHFVGSLPWASPEQAGGSRCGADLRSDTYSLGVVLYQLITGRFPYDVRCDLRTALSNIAEVAPVRPSQFCRGLDADVERIVLTSLEKEPARRYQNAIDLASDLRRFLNHEPIRARAPSSVYQFSKLIRRHRLAFAFTALLFGTVLASSVWLAVLYSKTNVALHNEMEAKRTADRQTIEAQREARTHAAVK